MYYRLKSQWGFRGWKNLPYAVIRKDGPDDDPVFYDQETFLDLLSLNGRENLEDGDFSPGGREAVRRLMEEDKLEVSGEPLAPLEKEQRYYVYPARCLRLAHWSITEKCNFKCRHCLVSSSGQGISLPISDCLHIMDEIRRCGIRRVDLTGGEPLIRPDFPELTGALTEKGLYMLATILKSKTAVNATFAIIETFSTVRGLKRELLDLHKENDSTKRRLKMEHFGNSLSEIVMPDLETAETESSLELNFIIGKIKHTVKRIKRKDE